MKVKIICLLYFLQIVFHSLSQEMKVSSVISDITDLSAKMSPRYSSDGKACALLKITCPQSGISFRADGIVGEIKYDNGEYLLYLACDAINIKILSQNNDGLNIDLSKYDILPLQSNMVYYVFIVMSNEISVDERVRLYKPIMCSKDEVLKLNEKADRVSLISGQYGTAEEKELFKLFDEKGCIKAGAMLGNHYIMGLLKGDSISYSNIKEGEYMLKVAVEYNDDASAAKLLGDYFYNSRSYNEAFEYYFIGHTKQNASASNCLALMMENGLGTQKDIEGALDIWRDLFWNRDHYTKTFILKNEALFEHFIRLKSSINTFADFSSNAVVKQAQEAYAENSHITIPEHIDWEQINRNYLPILFNKAVIALNNDASIDAALFFIDLFSRPRPARLTSYTTMDIFFPDDLPNKEKLISTSIHIIKEAASKDHIEAMKTLSKVYLDGKLETRSEEKALSILARGSQLGDASMAAKAEAILHSAYKYEEAFHYRQLAYDLGNRNWDLVLRLADNYASGEHCVKNHQKALELYKELLSRSTRDSDKSIIEKRMTGIKIKNKI